jgi:hypothetical protein
MWVRPSLPLLVSNLITIN